MYQTLTLFYTIRETPPQGTKMGKAQFDLLLEIIIVITGKLGKNPFPLFIAANRWCYRSEKDLAMFEPHVSL